MSNPWDIKRENFPSDSKLIDKVKFVLGYAILAPSTHNSQPWLFKIENDSVKIYYDHQLKLSEADPLSRDLYISMGCMVENLVIAASYFGIFKYIQTQRASLLNKDALCVAEVFFQDNGQENKGPEYLLDAIPERINARGFFESRILPATIQIEMMSLRKDDRIKINFIIDKEKIKKLAVITAEGLKLAYKKPSFRKEMSGWMHHSLSNKKTGLPGYSLKMPFVLSFIIPTLVRFFDISLLLAKLNYKSMSSAPFVCILSSEESNPSIWFEIGRLAERQMLYLNSQGIRTSIFVASIEMGDLYKKVQEVTGDNLIPQFLFCAGYMDHVQKHSPRHGVNEKIIK